MWLGLLKVVFNFTDPYASFHSEKTKYIGTSCPTSVMVFLPEGTLFYKTLNAFAECRCMVIWLASLPKGSDIFLFFQVFLVRMVKTVWGIGLFVFGCWMSDYNQRERESNPLIKLQISLLKFFCFIFNYR